MGPNQWIIITVNNLAVLSSILLLHCTVLVRSKHYVSLLANTINIMFVPGTRTYGQFCTVKIPACIYKYIVVLVVLLHGESPLEISLKLDYTED